MSVLSYRLLPGVGIKREICPRMKAAQQNFRVQKWISLLSVVLLAIKTVAYFITNSLAILTDALESIVNVVAGMVGLYSLYVAAKPNDREHPYGHGKAEFVSAFLEGAMIIGAGLVIMYESIKNLIEEQPIHSLDRGLILVGITALLNYGAGAVCLRIGKKNGSLALQASGKHLQTDTYSTLAVIAGLVIMLYTKVYWIDKVLALAMACFIVYNGYQIVRKSLAGIMDEADMDLLRNVVTILNEDRRVNWVDLHNLRMIKYGTTIHMDCHLTVPWYLNIHEAHHEVIELEKLVRTKFTDSMEMFVHTDGCLPISCPICSKQDCPVRQHPFQQRLEWTLENILQNKKHTLT